MSFNVTEKHIDDWYEENRWWADDLNIEEKIRLCKVFYIYQVTHQQRNPEIKIQTEDDRLKLAEKLAEKLGIKEYNELTNVDDVTASSLLPIPSTEKILQPFYSKYQDIKTLVKRKDVLILEINKDSYKGIQVKQYNLEIDKILKEIEFTTTTTTSKKVKFHISILYAVCVAKNNNNGCNDHFIRSFRSTNWMFSMFSFSDTFSDRNCQELINNIIVTNTAQLQKYEHLKIRQMVYDNMFNYFIEKNKNDIPVLVQIYYEIVHNAQCLYYGNISNAYNKFFVANTNNRTENPYTSRVYTYWEKIKKQVENETVEINMSDFYEDLCTYIIINDSSQNVKSIIDIILSKKKKHFTYYSKKKDKIVIEIKDEPSLLITKTETQFVNELNSFITPTNNTSLGNFYKFLVNDILYNTKFTYDSDRVNSHSVFLDKNKKNDSTTTGGLEISFSDFKDFLISDNKFLNKNNVNNKKIEIIMAIKNWNTTMNAYKGMDGSSKDGGGGYEYDGVVTDAQMIRLRKSIENVLFTFNGIITVAGSIKNYSDIQARSNLGIIRREPEPVPAAPALVYENDIIKCVLLAFGLILPNDMFPFSITINEIDLTINKNSVTCLTNSKYNYKLYCTTEDNIPSQIQDNNLFINVRNGACTDDERCFNRAKIMAQWIDNDFEYLEKTLLVTACNINYIETINYSFQRVFEKYSCNISILIFLIIISLLVWKTNTGKLYYKYDIIYDKEALNKLQLSELIEIQKNETKQIEHENMMYLYLKEIGKCYMLIDINNHKLIELGYSCKVSPSSPEHNISTTILSEFSEQTSIIKMESFPINILESDIKHCINLVNTGYEEIIKITGKLKIGNYHLTVQNIDILHREFLSDLYSKNLTSLNKRKRVVYDLTAESSESYCAAGVATAKNNPPVTFEVASELVSYIENINFVKPPSRIDTIVNTVVAYSTVIIPTTVVDTLSQITNYIYYYFNPTNPENDSIPFKYNSNDFKTYKNKINNNTSDNNPKTRTNVLRLADMLKVATVEREKGLGNISSAIKNRDETLLEYTLQVVSNNYLYIINMFKPTDKKDAYSKHSKFFLQQYFPIEYPKLLTDEEKKTKKELDGGGRSRSRHHKKKKISRNGKGKKSHKKSAHKKRSRNQKKDGKKSKKHREEKKTNKKKSRK